MVARAFHQGRGCKDAGLGGPKAFDDIVRVLCRVSTQATPAAVRQSYRVFFAVRAPFFTSLANLCLVVENVRSVGAMIPDETAIKLVVKSGMDGQFPVLGAHGLLGRNSRAAPFDLL